MHTVRGVGYVLRERDELPAPADAARCGAAVGDRRRARLRRSRYLVVRDTLRGADRRRAARRRAALRGAVARRGARRAGPPTASASIPAPAAGAALGLRRRSLDAAGEVVRRATPGRPTIPATRATIAAGRGRAGARRSRRPRRRRRRTCASARAAAGRRRRRSSRPLARRSTTARHAALGAACCWRWRDRRSRRLLARLVARPRPRRSPSSPTTAEHVAATRDLARRIDAHGDDEVGAPGARFNTMLEALERSRRRVGAAPARRRRLARAAHAAHQPAHEPRGAGAGDGPARARRGGGCASDLVEQIEELTALSPTSSSSRATRSRRRAVEDVRLDQLVGEARRARAPARAATSRFETDARADASSRACRPGSTARSPTCSTTRPSGARRAAWSRCACATAS